jgi:hypothetical protein
MNHHLLLQGMIVVLVMIVGYNFLDFDFVEVVDNFLDFDFVVVGRVEGGLCHWDLVHDKHYLQDRLMHIV